MASSANNTDVEALVGQYVQADQAIQAQSAQSAQSAESAESAQPDDVPVEWLGTAEMTDVQIWEAIVQRVRDNITPAESRHFKDDQPRKNSALHHKLMKQYRAELARLGRSVPEPSNFEIRSAIQMQVRQECLNDPTITPDEHRRTWTGCVARASTDEHGNHTDAYNRITQLYHAELTRLGRAIPVVRPPRVKPDKPDKPDKSAKKLAKSGKKLAKSGKKSGKHAKSGRSNRSNRSNRSDDESDHSGDESDDESAESDESDDQSDDDSDDQSDDSAVRSKSRKSTKSGKSGKKSAKSGKSGKKSAKLTKPTKPIKPTKRSRQIDSDDSTKTTKTTKSAKSAKSAKPSKSFEPESETDDEQDQ